MGGGSGEGDTAMVAVGAMPTPAKSTISLTHVKCSMKGCQIMVIRIAGKCGAHFCSHFMY